MDKLYNKGQYINDEGNLLPILGQFGIFLENDYERLINESVVPINFSYNTNRSNRKIVIVGSDGSPLLVPRNVFLALQLSGADTLDIKPSSLDEALIIENIIKNNNVNNIKTNVYIGTDSEIELSFSWRNAIEEATDIIVYGDYDLIEYYKLLNNEHRRVYTHENKISFGVIKGNAITDTIIDNMCFDFFSFYGFGSLSPKFYISVGEIDEDTLRAINTIYSLSYGEQIEEFRSKLNFAQKINLAKIVSGKKPFNYINTTKNTISIKPDILYGEIKILIVKSIDEVNKISKILSDHISTIAVDPTDSEVRSSIEYTMPSRICDIGSMHSLGFWESVDCLSDFDVYNNYQKE